MAARACRIRRGRHLDRAMLSAVIFYATLFFALMVVPATMILGALFLLDHRRHRRWHQRMLACASRAERLARWPAVDALAKRFPRARAFLRRRADPQAAWGLSATLAGIFILLGMWFFLAVLQDVLAKDPLVILDIRLHNAVALFRTPGMTGIMFTLTTLGSGPVIALVTLGICLHALARDRARLASVFALGLTATGLLSAALKLLAARARPVDSLLGWEQASFPSGHLLSATVVYGLLASVLLGSGGRPVVRAAGTTLLLLLIVGVGISRLYVGVHWPSDLLASLALAIVILASMLFVLHFGAPIPRLDTVRLPLPAGVMRLAGSGALMIALGATVFMVSRMESNPVPSPLAARLLDIDALRTGLPEGLPRWSEDLVGSRMEPISLVVIGSEASLLEAFARQGWTRADLPTPLRVAREAAAAMRNRPDASGPATPAFFADRPQDLTLEKPDASSPSIRRRHHARLWRTGYCLAPACRPLWVATASFDVGIGLSSRLHLPTHLIDPAVDAERARVSADLVRSGAVQQGSFAMVPSLRGENAGGDPFWTDGRAFVLVLP